MHACDSKLTLFNPLEITRGRIKTFRNNYKYACHVSLSAADT